MDELQLVVEGAPIVLHPLWLRDHCACPSCLDPSSGQLCRSLPALTVLGGGRVISSEEVLHLRNISRG